MTVIMAIRLDYTGGQFEFDAVEGVGFGVEQWSTVVG